MNVEMTRREVLKTMALAGAVLSAPSALAQLRGAVPAPSTREILAYLQTLRRDDHGYGWEDQVQSHLTPTFGVIGCFRLLGQTPPGGHARLVEYVRTHHPRELKKLEQERRVFEFQQVQALAWLGADVSAFRETIGVWKEPLAYKKQYERHGYPVFQSELGAVLARPLLGLSIDGMEKFAGYIDERRRANGSFNNTPAADGGDGHVTNTWWALQALAILRRAVDPKDELISWIRSCQRASGGFTFQPNPEFGGLDDVAYTRAAVRALALLGAAPADRDSCIRFIHSLANADGGFSDRPGWLSNPLATFYALDALDALGALDTIGRVPRRARRARQQLPGDLKVFTIQIESHGQGSPNDAVELARALKIDLWGAKNATPAWMARVRAIAAAKNVSVTFFTANEEYGTWVDVPGMGTYSHTSDLVAPANADIGPALGTRRSQGTVSWPEFRTRRLAPLEAAGGRLVWQFGENEELVRMLLDDSVKRGGFAAISTYHFGNPDFTNSEPFLHRWRGQIPFIALQDAHGTEPWWFADMTTSFRTLFLATAPTWDGWLNAMKQDWVVPVRHDQWTRGKTWMHSGSREVLDFVRAREMDWRWWDNPAIARPMVSIVPLTPADELETERPERGVLLRVRCAWENTTQGLAKNPISELVTLTVDGRGVKPELVARKRPNGLHEEHAHHYALPDAGPGTRHSATAVVRVIATKEEVRRTVDFVA